MPRFSLPIKNVIVPLVFMGILLLDFFPGQAQPTKIMALGNSITQGFRVSWIPGADSDSYRRSLWFKLQAAGLSVDMVGSLTETYEDSATNRDFDLDHEGHSAWRADNLLRGLPPWAIPGTGGDSLSHWLTLNVPDIVLMHVGTNDMLQGESVASTLADIEEIIDTIRAHNPNVHIFLAQIINVSATADAAANANIPLLNAQIPALAAAKTTPSSEITVVDMESVIDPDTETIEGIHPTPAGDAQMAQAWFDAMMATTFLPVEFLSFSAFADGDEAILKWATATETNNLGFEVEQFTGEGEFQSLGFVSGNGTVSEISEYEFRTGYLQPGTQVFRLKQVDLDGKTSFSDRVAVEIREGGSILLNLFPNPVRDLLNVEVVAKEGAYTQVRLYNMQGQLQEVPSSYEQVDIVQHWQLKTDGLTRGFYLVRIETEGQVMMKKVVVNR